MRRARRLQSAGSASALEFWARIPGAEKTLKTVVKALRRPGRGRLLFRTAPRAPRAGGFLFGTASGARLHSSAGGPCASASRPGVSVGVLGSDPRCSENLENSSKSAPAAEVLATQRSYCFIAYSTFKGSAERFEVLCAAALISGPGC